MFNNKIISLIGGTGSFGKRALAYIIKNYKVKQLRIFSRDEMKQWHLQDEYKNSKNIKFIIGDVRDKESLDRAIMGSDFVIHAAATKIVPTAEINPAECIKTNIYGAMNVINSCIENKIKKIIALSTDKACNPINLYGATKLCSDKLFVSANFLEHNSTSKFSVVRYGNVMGSRGSVIPFFLRQKDKGIFSITDKKMTRFLISLDEAINLVFLTFKEMQGGEIFIPKIPSMKIVDIARAINFKNKLNIIGIRAGEKLHEQMIGIEDAQSTYDFGKYFKILPTNLTKQKIKTYIKKGKKVPLEFSYSSDKNHFLTIESFKLILEKLKISPSI